MQLRLTFKGHAAEGQQAPACRNSPLRPIWARSLCDFWCSEAATNCLGIRLPPACVPQIGHAVLAEERGQEGEQSVDPTETVPFPDALLQVSWVVQASAAGGSSTATLLRL